VHITYVQNLDICVTHGDRNKNSEEVKKLKNGKKNRKRKKKMWLVSVCHVRTLHAQSRSIGGQKREKNARREEVRLRPRTRHSLIVRCARKK
jgi:hypothetical protein